MINLSYAGGLKIRKVFGDLEHLKPGAGVDMIIFLKYSMAWLIVSTIYLIIQSILQGHQLFDALVNGLAATFFLIYPAAFLAAVQAVLYSVCGLWRKKHRKLMVVVWFVVSGLLFWLIQGFFASLGIGGLPNLVGTSASWFMLCFMGGGVLSYVCPDEEEEQD